MDAAAFDAWRARYDEMSYQEMVDFYDRVEVDHPRQTHFDAWAFLRFFSHVIKILKSVSVFELGGWKGELANTMLRRFDGIDEWVNVEISQRARDLSVCHDRRYFALVPDDFIWQTLMPEADVFVSSHTIEHLKARHLAALLDRLPPTVCYAALQAPLPESATGHDWSGYWGAHVLEIGWQQVTEMLRERGFEPAGVVQTDEFRVFVRVK